MVETKLALALLNLCLSIGISVISFCRINDLPPGLPFRQIVPYALMLTGGLVSGLQPWMGYWPTPNQVFLCAAFFAYLISTRTRTRTG